MSPPFGKKQSCSILRAKKPTWRNTLRCSITSVNYSLTLGGILRLNKQNPSRDGTDNSCRGIPYTPVRRSKCNLAKVQKVWKASRTPASSAVAVPRGSTRFAHRRSASSHRGALGSHMSNPPVYSPAVYWRVGPRWERRECRPQEPIRPWRSRHLLELGSSLSIRAKQQNSLRKPRQTPRAGRSLRPGFL